MGWIKHVDFVRTRCLACGVVDTWEYWDEVALARYSGEFGKKLGHDAKDHHRCPHCGSTEGEATSENCCWEDDE